MVIGTVVMLAAVLAFSTFNNQGLAIGGSVSRSDLSMDVLESLKDSSVVRWVVMDVNPVPFQTEESFSFIFPFATNPKTFNLTRERAEYADNGEMKTWVGKDVEDPLSTVIFVWNNGYVAASFVTAKRNANGDYRNYSISAHSSPGKGIAIESDPTKSPVLGEDAIEPPAEEPVANEETSSSESSDSDSGSITEITSEDASVPSSETIAETTSTTGKKPAFFSTKLFSIPKVTAEFQAVPVVIDVLVAYTHTAMLRFGTTPHPIETEINLYEAQTNNALLAGNTNTQIRVVYKYETTFTEGKKMQQNLDRLTSKHDNYMDEVHAIRHARGADLVVLLTGRLDHDRGGIAWILSPSMVYYGTVYMRGFSVVTSWPNLSTFQIFPHELGHNMGMDHDPSHGGDGFFSYSRGYHDPSEMFRTIMAYDCPTVPWCPYIGYYSNPNTPINGNNIGGPTQNNARNLTTSYGGKTIAKRLADNEGSVILPMPPENLSATDGLVAETIIVWDSSENSSSYDVYRDTTKIGNTTQTIFHDTMAMHDVVYTYSVKGVDMDNATSSFSNGDAGYFTTLASPPSPPLSLHSTSYTSNSIQIAWTPGTSVPVTEYKIYLGNMYDTAGCVHYFKTVSGTAVSDTLSGLYPGVLSTLSMQAVNANGTGACTPKVYVATAPKAVTTLAATQGATDLKLSWTLTGGATFQNIHRSTTPGFQPDSSNLIYRASFSGLGAYLTYSDTTAVPGTVYYYKVVEELNITLHAITVKTFSDPSNETYGFIGTPGIAPPSNIHSSNVTSTSATIAWTPSTSILVDGYQIFLSTTSSTPCTTLFKTVTGNVTSDTATNLTPGSTYYLSMKSLAGTTPSACAVQPLTAFVTPPLAPIDTFISAPIQNELALTFTPSMLYGLVSQNIYRSTAQGFTPNTATKIFTGNASEPALHIANGIVTFVDGAWSTPAATSGTYYCYRVSTAANIQGQWVESAPSQEACGTYP